MYKNHDYLKISSKIKYLAFLCIYLLLYPLAKLLYGKKNNWLICERGNDAQDNGFIFFQYVCQYHNNINATYIIDYKSIDYDKVNNIGKTVNYRSFKHFLMVIGCHVKISSHLFGYSCWSQVTTFFRRNKTRDIHVFLQHGIIKNMHEGLLGDVCKSLDLFVCGAEPEYNYILKTFNYDKKIPQYTGLARYDLLNNFTLKNQIIIMPTWRAYLSGLSEQEFIKSNFYMNWIKILNDNKLINVCKHQKIDIKFYLHYSFQKFTHLFNKNNFVNVISYGEESVQNLLKESKLLITDFSSVYFDFGYMNKPVVYFQFDEILFNDEHYTKGYFDYRRDGFGDVCTTVVDTIDKIVEIIMNNFNIEKKYLFRMNKYFRFRDNNNCERIYNHIFNLSINKKY